MKKPIIPELETQQKYPLFYAEATKTINDIIKHITKERGVYTSNIEPDPKEHIYWFNTNLNVLCKYDENIKAFVAIGGEGSGGVDYDTLMSLLDKKQNINDDNLNTNDTTIIGAINEINGNIQEAKNKIEELYNDKQDKTDNTLNTKDKTITGAINEINTKVYKKGYNIGVVYISESIEPNAGQITIKPNTYYNIIPENIEVLEIIRDEFVDDTTNEFLIRLDTTNCENLELVFMYYPIYWHNNEAPEIKQNHIYEISILDDLACFIEYDKTLE